MAIKREEISNPNSCFNKAGDDDYIFVLIDKDISMPGTIRLWTEERVALGKNEPADP